MLSLCPQSPRLPVRQLFLLVPALVTRKTRLLLFAQTPGGAELWLAACRVESRCVDRETEFEHWVRRMMLSEDGAARGQAGVELVMEESFVDFSRTPSSAFAG